jgi:hypothetical protein
MNKNIMCVCASRDTADIGFYDVDVFRDKIGNVRLEDWKEIPGLNAKDVADVIAELCEDSDYSMIIVDCRGIGMGIVDELEKNSDFTIPIYKGYPNGVIINCGILKANEYVKSNKVSLDRGLNVDLNKFKFNQVSSNGKLVLDVESNEKEFMNMVQFFAFVEKSVLDDKKIKNKTTIENNLTQILEILVYDLCEVDKSDIIAVNNLVRLIDKVNYIRNQY